MEKSVRCDVSARMKGKVYNGEMVVRPAMLYGLRTVALKKRQDTELEVAEIKMLHFSLGVTKMDRIGNEYIRGTAHVRRFGEKVRGQTEMVWMMDDEVGSARQEFAGVRENDAEDLL